MAERNDNELNVNVNECVKVQNIFFKVGIIVKFMVHPFVEQFVS